MGYRSEVAVVVKNEDYEKFIRGNSDFKDLMDIAEVTKNEDLVMIYWDWVKWYTEYTDIQKFESVLACIADNGHPYDFTRIGEDRTDIDIVEEPGEDDEYLGEYIYPVTYIDKPTGWEKIN